MTATDDGDIATGRAAHESRPARLGPLHQHVETPAHETAAIPVRQFALDVEQPCPPLGDDGRRHALAPAGRLGALTRTVRKQVNAGEADFTDDATGRFEVGVGLAGEAENDIGAEGGSIERRA